MYLICLILAAVLGNSLFFKALPLEDTGLNIATVCQDSLGNMWYGGIDGLTRYDGKRYTHFKNSSTSDLYAPDSHIYMLFCDEKGIVWASHINGLSAYDPATDSFVNHPGPGGSISRFVQVSSRRFLLIIDKRLWVFDKESGRFSREGINAELLGMEASSLYSNSGTIYIGTSNGALYAMSDSMSDARMLLSPDGNRINCILQDDVQHLWLGTEGDGLWEVDLNGITHCRFIDKSNSESNRTDYVKSLCLDKNGLLWVGTKNGLKILENDRFKVFHYDYYSIGGITHDSVSDIFMDSQGTMWLGTYYGGVCYCNPHSSQFESIVSRPGTGNLYGNVISDIVEDHDGSLWIGTNSGGLNHMRTDGRCDHIGSDGDNPVDVKCIFVSPRSGRIYIGADRSEILVLDRNKMKLRPLGMGGPHSAYGCYAIVNNLRGGFYAGGSDGLYEYDEKTGHFSKLYISEDVSNVKSMTLDSDGVLWIGKKYGITAINTKTGRVMDLPDPLTSVQYVESFWESAGGIMWIGSNSGLYSYDAITGETASFTEREGLPDHVIHGIEGDAFGILWISTDNGMCRMDPSNGNAWTFTTADGLLDNRFTPYAHCRTKSGKMYFGSLHGIISFDPASVTMHSELVSPVISGIEVNGIWRSITTDNLVLKPHERDIVFIFSCPDYISGDNGRFFYKLEGFDADWCEAGKEWQAVYPMLRPGDFTFRLRYRNSAGVDSDSETVLRVRLRSPWYKTYAARMTGVLLLILIVLFVFIWLLSRKDREYEARMDKARSDLLREFSLEFVNIGANKASDKESTVAQSFNSSDEVFMRQAMKVVKDNIDNSDFSIDDFAAGMLMSRSNLNLRVRALFGVSPLEFIKTVRFNEACRLLMESKYSVAEISYMVGFTTPSYFTAAFRHFMGCTPSEYVRQNGKK